MQLVWFRKDLRISDNPALFNACRQGQVTALYFATPKQWQTHHSAPIQADFIEKSLNSLRQSLARLGIKLIIAEVADFSQIPMRLKALTEQYHVQCIHANREPEINEIERDNSVLRLALPLRLYQGDCILAPGSVLTKQGGMYKVFSAFRNAWMAQIKALDITPLAQPKAVGEMLETTPLSINYPKASSAAFPGSERDAKQLLADFIEHHIVHYGRQRDIPSLDATSHLSPYLAIGVLSAKTCVYQVLQAFPYALDDKSSGAYIWINEIVWREFYRHLMIANPNLCKGYNYNQLADGIVWQNNREQFERWCQGKTGYGLVDAAMRQLNTTGWMHNRLRMLTASFLTKHLLIDWRWGESYFMRHLIDGDLASNNGGWQWAASTGCDAQPYFRIFNPIIQSQKFDPKGLFIRKYVQELSDYDDQKIHYPVNALVEHRAARINALDRFSVLKKG
ncbi:MAG: deoxyribodipyrimidine photo-lyase [Psychromonas sp.]|nr:deoxyribodipyrimidine photo-lyase [Psychromonas sp.]